jgi:hypothetical protein
MAMKATGCTFKNAIVHVDGQRYRECRFERCQLVYSGGDLPSMVDCEFLRCRWTLEGAGARTLRLMKAMVERGGSMRGLVERSLGLTERPVPLPDATPAGADPSGGNRLDKRLH